MKYVVILAAIIGMALGCQSQKTVAATEPKYKPLSEVQSVSMEAQNYNSKMRPMKDTMLVIRPETNTQFKSFNEVKGVDMGAQNYNNRRFSTDTIYLDRIDTDSLKN
jgi:hypothetical protein